MGDALPKTARLMTVETVRGEESFGHKVVRIYPSIPLPNDAAWNDFSAVVDIARPTGDRFQRRAYFYRVHPHFRVGTGQRDGPLPFWVMTITLIGVGVDDVPAGSVIFADEAVVASLTPHLKWSSTH